MPKPNIIDPLRRCSTLIDIRENRGGVAPLTTIDDYLRRLDPPAGEGEPIKEHPLLKSPQFAGIANMQDFVNRYPDLTAAELEQVLALNPTLRQQLQNASRYSPATPRR